MNLINPISVLMNGASLNHILIINLHNVYRIRRKEVEQLKDKCLLNEYK